MRTQASLTSDTVLPSVRPAWSLLVRSSRARLSSASFALLASISALRLDSPADDMVCV